MNKFFLAFQYLNYIVSAKGKHSLHSPFAFQFYTEVIKGKKKYPDFIPIEVLRKKLKNDFTKIEVTDFGAGSKVDNSNVRTISSICRNAEKSSSLAQLIYRIVQFQKPSIILDLGTSLGITTLYESKAYPSGKIYSFEGCPNIAAEAVKNFAKLSTNNVEMIVGDIDKTLPELIKKITTVDFVFFDANHRYQPTLNYFNCCVEKVNKDSIFIFDDIYWSPEMTKAWKEIKRHTAVGMTMDLFYFGIVFFRKKQPVQHFTLK